MIGTPPSFSLGADLPAAAAGGAALAALGTGGGAACAAGGAGAGGSGCAGSARNEAFVSMPSSSTSRVPRRSCQKRCSWTSLYLAKAAAAVSRAQQRSMRAQADASRKAQRFRARAPAGLEHRGRHDHRLDVFGLRVAPTLHRVLQQLKHRAKRLRRQRRTQRRPQRHVPEQRRARAARARALCLDSRMLLRSCSCAHVPSDTSSGPGSRPSLRTAGCCAPAAPERRGRLACGAPPSASPPARNASKRLRSVMATVATPAPRASCGGRRGCSRTATAARTRSAPRLQIRGGVDDAWVPRRKLRQKAEHVEPICLLHARAQQRVPREARAAREGDAVIRNHRAAQRRQLSAAVRASERAHAPVQRARRGRAQQRIQRRLLRRRHAAAR
jgi:hypothetical protein